MLHLAIRKFQTVRPTFAGDQLYTSQSFQLGCSQGRAMVPRKVHIRIFHLHKMKSYQE